MSQQFLPLLKPENIEELKSLILNIMDDNDSKLQRIIESNQNKAIQNQTQFTLDDLNEILTEQCLQRQKIITNLGHFARKTSPFNLVSLMNTISVLWQDNQDLQYKIKDQNQVVQDINNHAYELSKQSDFLKNKLQQIYFDLHKVQQQKHAIQEYLNQVLNKHQASFDGKHFSTIPEPQTTLPLFSEFIQNNQENLQNQCIQANQLRKDHNLQDSISAIQEQQQNQNDYKHQHEAHLLEESIIKDSISVIRRFTLSNEVENRYKFFSQTEEQAKFIQKNDKFSLINEVSVQIFQQPKSILAFQKPQSLIVSEKSINSKQMIRNLRFSNEKINVTIATGTQFTKTKDQQKCYQEPFSVLQDSSSCTSFMLNRQTSAIMYPFLQRASSSVSFVSKSTKCIQTELPPSKSKVINQFKKTQKRSIGIDSIKLKNPQKQQIVQKVAKAKHQNKEEDNGKKSLSQLFNYFTKKIVSDRIKANNKKNDIKGFQKTKSNILKIA